MNNKEKIEFIKSSIEKWEEFLDDMNRAGKSPTNLLYPRLDYFTKYWRPCGYCKIAETLAELSFIQEEYICHFCSLYVKEEGKEKYCSKEFDELSMVSNAIKYANEKNYLVAKILATDLLEKMRQDLKKETELQENPQTIRLKFCVE
ncbi:MAG: hypothetical protein SVO01_00320 [Thermotogota bacterium]|nr:hypothetical protein [Thermotogota bacterium]